MNKRDERLCMNTVNSIQKEKYIEEEKRKFAYQDLSNADHMNDKMHYNYIFEINVKYFDPALEKIEKLSEGNWIDLRCADNVELKQGEFALLPLGIAMEIPRGYEVLLAPRSSTFKNYGIIQTNSIGVIDGPDRVNGNCGYCGDDDMWMMPVFATRDTSIRFNDRICQFRIIEQQPGLLFKTVDHLVGKNRGGFGSTGIN